LIYFKTVKWKNFLSTGNNPTEVSLDKSKTTLIIGENGAGKSTVLDALCFGLFGKPYRPIKKNQLINSINTSGTLVEVNFTIGKNKFIVRRGIKPNIFEIIRNDEPMDQEAHSRDFQKILEDQILKLNYKSFTQVVILGSSCFIPFMQLSTSHRREVVEDILDIKIFSVMNLLLKQHYKNISGEQNDLILEENLYKTKKEVEEDSLKKLEKDSENRITALTEERDKYRSQAHDKEIRNLEVSHALQSRTSVNDDCPICEQPIKKSFKKLRNSELLDQIQKYERALDEMELEIDKLQLQLSELNTLSEEFQSNSAETNALHSMAEKCQKDLDLVSSDRENIGALKESINSLKTNLEEIDIRNKELKEDLFYLDICKNLLHDTGIKSKIIKQYLPVMNQTIQKYLGVLDFYVNFHLNEQFEETIKSRYRDDFSYASFSEGEKMRIDLALMFTWREIARLKNSTNTNLLIMDEVFDSSLDASGTDDFLKILNSLESQNIFVISHKGDVLFDKFHSIMKFEKQNNFSRIQEN